MDSPWLPLEFGCLSIPGSLIYSRWNIVAPRMVHKVWTLTRSSMVRVSSSWWACSVWSEGLSVAVRRLHWSDGRCFAWVFRPIEIFMQGANGVEQQALHGFVLFSEIFSAKAMSLFCHTFFIPSYLTRISYICYCSFATYDGGYCFRKLITVSIANSAPMIQCAWMTKMFHSSVCRPDDCGIHLPTWLRCLGGDG